jgi:hypothetical protein
MPLDVDPAWQQGSLVPHEIFALAAPAGTEQLSEDDVVIVLSQSCDVVCDSAESEPFLDVLVGRAIQDLVGNNTFGKNPRVIDFEIVAEGRARKVRCHDAERLRLDRKVLQGAVPADRLAPSLTAMLANWTGRRYTRPALPDSFNRRRKPAANRVSKIAAQYALDVAAFYVVLNTERDLPEGEAYRVILIGTVMSDIAGDEARFGRAVEAVAKLAKALQCDGIEVIEAVAKSEDDVSLSDLRNMIRLELDYVSVRGGIVDEPTPHI